MPGWAGVLRISGLILFFAALCLGLIWILQAWQARAYGERLLNLVAGFIFVPGGLWAVIDWQSHTDVRYLSLASFLALAGVNLAAALMGLLQDEPAEVIAILCVTTKYRVIAYQESSELYSALRFSG